MKGSKKVEVELYRLGELPRSWEKRIDRNDVESRVGEILASDRDILERYKPSAMAAAIEEKAGRAKKGRAASMGVRTMRIMTAAAAALVLAFLLPLAWTGEEGVPGTEDITRVKGSSAGELKIFRQRGAATELLEDRSYASEGDLVQMGYRLPRGMDYALIVSIDGRGIVTRHLAPAGQVTPRAEESGFTLLGFSYQLDDAPEFETFYLVASDQPFPVDPVVDILSREARGREEELDIPRLIRSSDLDSEGIGKLKQVAVTIRKEEKGETE